MIDKANYRSIEISGATTFEPDTTRNYFMVVASGGNTDVAFGVGGANITVAAADILEPNVVPTGTVTVTPTSTAIVVISGVGA